jgi:hypothetical protein
VKSETQPAIGKPELSQTAEDLEPGDGIDVATVDKRSDERTSVALHGRHRNEVEEAVGPEDCKHEPEQESNDDDGVFHGGCLVITSVEVNQSQ